MKIWKISEEAIEFYDGSKITYHHDPDCCEDNYADFEQLEDGAFKYDFKLPLKFEAIEDAGFRFGDKNRLFFVPCYSVQNGYYSSEITISYDGKEKLSFGAEMR
jgi:hypothetical protein